jgi:predicted dehydrogenase
MGKRPLDDSRPVLVGSGFIASRHVAALGQMGVRPAGVWSPTEAHATAAARRWGCEAAPSLDDALDMATHVHVCSPPVQHEEAVLRACGHRMTILCEKPLAATADAARRMEEAVDTARNPAHVLFNLRMAEGVRLLRRAVGEGYLGTVVSVFGSYRQQWNAAPSSRDWRFDPAHVGPSRVITEIGSHLIDLTEFVLGRPLDHVHALTASMGERPFVAAGQSGRVAPPNEDVFSVQFRAGEAIGHLCGTELAHGAYDQIDLVVDGSDRSAVWHSSDPGRVSLDSKTEGRRTYGRLEPADSVAACIEAIYTGEPGPAGVATFGDGVRNCSVMDAVRTSAAGGGWQAVPDPPAAATARAGSVPT